MWWVEVREGVCRKGGMRVWGRRGVGMRLTGRFLGCLVGSLWRVEFDIKKSIADGWPMKQSVGALFKYSQIRQKKDKQTAE
jgi:hypothetical protein